MATPSTFPPNTGIYVNNSVGHRKLIYRDAPYNTGKLYI